MLAASIFHYGAYSIAETKEYLAARGIPVRPAVRRRARRAVSGRRVDLAAPPDDLAGGGASLPLPSLAARLVCFPTDTVYGVGGAVQHGNSGRHRGRQGPRARQAAAGDLPDGRLLLGRLSLRAPARRRRAPPAAGSAHPRSCRIPKAGRARRPAMPAAGRPSACACRAWPRGAQLMGRLAVPLVASSANRSGEKPAGGAWRAPTRRYSRACDLVLDGGEIDGRAVERDRPVAVRRRRFVAPAARGRLGRSARGRRAGAQRGGMT